VERLRTPIFVIALVLGVVVLAIETGSTLLGPPEPPRSALAAILDDAPWYARQELDLSDLRKLRTDNPSPPGRAIPSLAFLDFLLLYTLGLMAVGMLIGERVHGRIQGIATLIVSIVVILLGIIAIFKILAELMLMLGLFFSWPFGTIAYMARYGFFQRGAAEGLLGTLTIIKLGLAVCLLLAHQRFIQNKGLVLFLATSVVADFIILILHGFVPIFLVSITDAVGGIIVVILAIIWTVVLLISSIVSVIKAVRVSRST
jgi:hypothetical protein